MHNLNAEQTSILVIAVVFLLVGVAVLVCMVKKRKQAIESEAWPKTKGEIEFSHWKTVGERWSVKPSIRYKYTISGKQYYSNRLSLWWSSHKYIADGDVQSKIQKDYPVGKIVDVFYNPNNPNIGVLYTGLNTFSKASMIFWLISSVIIMVLSTFIIVLIVF